MSTQVFFSKYQFGFRKGLSTVDALLELSENIYESLDNKKHHLTLLIDLSKAFDTLKHDILLSKLEKSGVHITLVTEVSQKGIGQSRRDGMIRATLKSRAQIPRF